MTRASTALACVGVLAAAAPARAQPRTPAAAGRVELAVGVAWNVGTTMTPIAVTETQGDGTARTVFNVGREQTSAAGLEARIGVRVTSRVDVEATGSYARPKLQLIPSNDVEGAASTTASEQLQEFTIGGAALWYPRRRNASRTLPFVIGGVAYSRQLHETSTLVETGMLFDIGAGVKRTLMQRRGTLKAIGVRAEGRVRIRASALAVDASTHASPALAASLFFRF